MVQIYKQVQLEIGELCDIRQSLRQSVHDIQKYIDKTDPKSVSHINSVKEIQKRHRILEDKLSRL